MYCLLYNPKLNVSLINSSLTLVSLIDQLNDSLQKDLSQHTETEKNLLAKAIRLNWLVENLKTEPVYKPLLLNLKYFSLNILVGDTRKLAVELNPNIKTLPVLLTVKSQYQDQFSDWQKINDIEHLSDIVKLDTNKILLSSNIKSFDQELDQIEFDYVHTSNHMHNEHQRLNMMYNYLKNRPNNFYFDQNWFTTPIDWNLYDF